MSRTLIGCTEQNPLQGTRTNRRITTARGRLWKYMYGRKMDLYYFDTKIATLFQLQKLYNIWTYVKMSLNFMKGCGRRRSRRVSALPLRDRRSSNVNVSLRPTWLPEPLALSLHFTCICCTICLYVFLSDGECLPIVILIGFYCHTSLCLLAEKISQNKSGSSGALQCGPTARSAFRNFQVLT